MKCPRCGPREGEGTCVVCHALFDGEWVIMIPSRLINQSLRLLLTKWKQLAQMQRDRGHIHR